MKAVSIRINWLELIWRWTPVTSKIWSTNWKIWVILVPKWILWAWRRLRNLHWDHSLLPVVLFLPPILVQIHRHSLSHRPQRSSRKKWPHLILEAGYWNGTIATRARNEPIPIQPTPNPCGRIKNGKATLRLHQTPNARLIQQPLTTTRPR